ncbi:chemotaxis protein CheW [Desulfuromonas acetoxidans]|uniref:CheW protein n=1 Tax=Desulfuromonas acetoxidans (strain DSM 684 / 11070) TaxID=281689 RepID=Q1JYP4_DESA6|nr:chemotaxis protein CheW [Desulfuromonas acetoxidans]EAT15371.1 CheW protein [Desulfuromonas acetoxidans DSM 684]
MMSDVENTMVDETFETMDMAQKDLYLNFHIGSEDFGIDIAHVIEIIGIQRITAVPDMPHYMQGVINLRGKVISVMDVRLRFDMEQREYDDRTCVVVVNVGEDTVGLIVDRVNEVVEISSNQIQPVPQLQLNEDYIMGLGKLNDEVKILIDVDRLINEGDFVEAA